MGNELHPVVVAEARTPLEASLICQQLGSEGIQAIPADEHVVTVYGGLLQPSVGGVKITVPASDAERAARLLGREQESPRKAPENKNDLIRRAGQVALLGFFLTPACSPLAIHFLWKARTAPGSWDELRSKVWATVAILFAQLAFWGVLTYVAVTYS